MKALIWKEIRELAPGFWLLLLASWTVGVVDVAYNWNEDRGVGLSLVVCLVISLVAALLAGANSYARESREQIVFLGSWPVSRGRIWLAKTITPAVMWALLVALGTGGCLGLLAMRGHYPNVSSAFDIGNDGWIMPMAWVLLYAMGLLASVALPSAMGATMVAVIALGAVVWGYLWAWDFVPAYGGPRLGLALPDIEGTSHLPPALVVAAICLIVSAVVATRALYRATWRRITRAAAGLAVGIGLALLAVLAAWLVANSRFPDAVNMSLDGTGRYVMLNSHGGSGGAQGLWSLELDSGKLRQISRAGGTITDSAADAPRVAIDWEVPGRYRDYVWVADLTTGELWRTEAEGRSVALSPDGKWLATIDDGLTVYPVATPRGVRLEGERPISRAIFPRPPLAWAPDGESIYVVTSRELDEPSRLLEVDAFSGSQSREVAQVERGWIGWGAPTHGRWATFILSQNAPQAPNEMGLLDMETGRITLLGEWSINYRGWAADGKHAWAKREVGDREYELALRDLATGEPVRVLTSEDFGGSMVLSGTASPHSADTLFLVFTPGSSSLQPAREWWWLPDTRAPAPKRLEITDEDRVGGWAASGEIILLRGRTVEALDPETGQHRVIRELPGREPEADEDAT